MGGLHEALSKAIADCGEGVSKERTAQGYKFRGIDQVLNFLNPIMARHQLALVPHNVTDEQVIERQTKAGGAAYFARAKVEFRLYHSSGESLPAMAWVEAMDTSDKALNKVMSIAWKYAAIQTFCIPVEDVADENTTSPAMEPSRGPEPAQPPEQPSEPSSPTLFQLVFEGWEGQPLGEATTDILTLYLAHIEREVKRNPQWSAEKKRGMRAHYATVKKVIEARV